MSTTTESISTMSHVVSVASAMHVLFEATWPVVRERLAYARRSDAAWRAYLKLGYLMHYAVMAHDAEEDAPHGIPEAVLGQDIQNLIAYLAVCSDAQLDDEVKAAVAADGKTWIFEQASEAENRQMRARIDMLIRGAYRLRYLVRLGLLSIEEIPEGFVDARLAELANVYTRLGTTDQSQLREPCQRVVERLEEIAALQRGEQLPPLQYGFGDFVPDDAERNLVGSETWYYWFEAYRYLNEQMYEQPQHSADRELQVQMFMLGTDSYAIKHGKLFECPPECVASADMPFPEISGFDMNGLFAQLRSGDSWHQRFQRLRWDEEPSAELVAAFEQDTSIGGSSVTAPEE